MDNAKKDKIYSIMQSATGINVETLQREKPLRDQIDLDSMQFLAVIAKLENDLGIELPLSVMEAQTMSEFFTELDRELGE